MKEVNIFLKHTTTVASHAQLLDQHAPSGVGDI